MAPPDRRTELATRWALPALLVLACFLYRPALHGPFVFDDWHTIVQNPHVRSLSNIPAFFTDASTFSILEGNRDYRPVHSTAIALAWGVADGSPWPFRVLGVLVHVVSATLLGAVVLTLARRAPQTAEWTERQRRLAAATAALLFTVHPLATQTVLYASAHAELLASMFCLASFCAFAAADRPEGPRHRRLAILSLLGYATALLAKPAAICLPLLLLLWEALLGPSRLGGRGTSRSRWQSVLLRQAPFWVLSIAYLGLRTLVTPEGLRTGVGSSHGRSVWIPTQLEALYAYYGRAVLWPTDLNVDREYELVSTALSPRFLGALGLTAALAVALAVLWRERRRQLVFWILWFPSAMALTSFVVVLFQVVNEHRVYLPLAGACAFAGLSLVDLGRGRPALRPLLATVATGAVVALAVGTFVRSGVWASELRLWEDAASSRGTWRAHMNYGLALEKVGRREEALQAFDEAVRRGPFAFAYLNRGLAMIRRGRMDEGLADLAQARQLWPSSPDVRTHYGLGLFSAGRLAEAEGELRAALELRPDFLKALNGLARLLDRQGRAREADEVRAEIARVDPTATETRRATEGGAAAGTDPSWEAIVRTGITAVAEGRHDDGARLLRGARNNVEPRSDLLFALGFAEQKRGETEAAREAYEALLALEPDHVRGTFNLAYELLTSPRDDADLERAAALFRRTRELDPTYDETLYREASALRALERIPEAELLDAAFLTRLEADSGLRRKAAARLTSGRR